MAIDTAALTTYSWADIAKAAKQAMITSAIGGSRLVINGRDITRISVTDAKELYSFAIEMQDIEAGNDGNALIQFGEAQ
jgi:hypothetical protein